MAVHLPSIRPEGVEETEEELLSAAADTDSSTNDVFQREKRNWCETSVHQEGVLTADGDLMMSEDV